MLLPEEIHVQTRIHVCIQIDIDICAHAVESSCHGWYMKAASALQTRLYDASA